VCCEAADEEQLRYEADLFDCERCPVAKARAEVWPENLDAWQTFKRIASRIVIETQLGSEVFRKLTEDRTADEVHDLLERLDMIHEMVCPPKKQT
jgi:hypothetical protein